MLRQQPTTWLARLEERTLPQFNQLVIWLLLATAAILAAWPFQVTAGQRQGVVTLLWWLPDSVVTSDTTWHFFRGLLVAGIVLWSLAPWLPWSLPWSCWLTVIGFTGRWSLHVETTYNTSHIFHLANMLLILQAIWITGDARLIKQTLAAGTYWQTPLVPRWVSLTSIAYIGLFHSAAGISKLFFSGPAWANGTSLQLWTYLWGRRWSPTTQLMLSSRSFTRALQVFTLIVESSGLFAIVPRLRPWIGLALLGFYAGVLATFDYGFQFNAILTAVYFLPVESWLTHRAEQRPCS